MVRERIGFRILGLCIFAAFLLLPSQSQAQGFQKWIVGYKHHLSLHAMRAASPSSARIIKTIPGSKAAVALIPSGSSSKSIRNQLLAQDEVRYIEPDQTVHTFDQPNDTYWNNLWGMASIGLPDAWGQSNAADGNGVVVAVTDSGIQADHPDLQNQLWTNPGEIAGNGTDDDGNGKIDDVHGYSFLNNTGTLTDSGFHGTHVSGTIAAERNNNQGVVGVAPGAKIMALQFIGQSGGSLDAGIAAINYAVSKGAKIINASWGGGGYSQTLYDAIKAARDAGVLFVAAAGNNGQDSDKSPNYPAAYNLENIISVVALDSSNNKASFSNWGAISTDIGAPGVNILSTVPSNTYNYLQGTSMASPHVAGAAAALWSKTPSASYSDIKSAILNGGNDTPSLAGQTRTSTGKRLNLAGAFNQLDALVNGPQSISAPTLSFVSGKLNCSNGVWIPANPKYLTYSWTKNNQLINGANKNFLAISNGDRGSSFVCSVKASTVSTSSNSSRTASSQALIPNNAPPTPGIVKVSGFNGLDGVLNCDRGAWQNGNISFVYSWSRDGAQIQGEAGSSYTIKLADRGHSITCVVAGTNATATVTAESAGFAVGWDDDNQAPAPPSATGIPSINNRTSFTFTIRGEKNARAYCSVDDGEYLPCGSPFTVSKLGEGNHRLGVKQKDQAGNLSEASQQNWTTDLTAPAAPTWGYSFDLAALAADTTPFPGVASNASIMFFLSGDGSSTMICSLDSTRLNNCPSVVRYSGMRRGRRIFRVQQVDQAGNGSPMVTVVWSVP